jgi:hypothetical protein
VAPPLARPGDPSPECRGLVSGSGPGSSYIRDIGVGLGLGILRDTFLVRTLLVPSTVAWSAGGTGGRPG